MNRVYAFPWLAIHNIPLSVSYRGYVFLRLAIHNIPLNVNYRGYVFLRLAIHHNRNYGFPWQFIHNKLLSTGYWDYAYPWLPI